MLAAENSYLVTQHYNSLQSGIALHIWKTKHEEAHILLIQEATEHCDCIYSEYDYEAQILTHKEGILEGKMEKGRMPFTQQQWSA